MKPTVYMMLGLPGSGKTTFSKELQKELGLERFSLDEEYFARVGNEQQEHRDFSIEKEIGDDIKKRVAKTVRSGSSVILDLCPWQKTERDEYRDFIKSLGAECIIYYFDVPREELINRLESRNQASNSNHQFMTPEMLDDFYKRFDPPEPDEQVIVVPAPEIS